MGCVDSGRLGRVIFSVLSFLVISFGVNATIVLQSYRLLDCYADSNRLSLMGYV